MKKVADTPFQAPKKKDLERRLRCLKDIFSIIPETNLIWEAFGGIGFMTGVIRRYSNAQIIATELNAECVSSYNAKGLGICYQCDAVEFLSTFNPPFRWGASLDYNNFTITDLYGRGRSCSILLNLVISKKPIWIQITDTARKYLHLNYKRYGLHSKDNLEYITAFIDKFNALSDNHYNKCVYSERYDATMILFSIK